MWKKPLLREYKKDVKSIIKSAKESGLNDEQIKELFQQSFLHIKTDKVSSGQSFHQLKISVLISAFIVLFIYILLNVHTPTSSIVLRNVQGLTYPALKIVRTLSVPIIKLFPSLTGKYNTYHLWYK